MEDLRREVVNEIESAKFQNSKSIEKPKEKLVGIREIVPMENTG